MTVDSLPLSHDAWVDQQVATGGRVGPFDFLSAAARLGIKVPEGVAEPQEWYLGTRHRRGLTRSKITVDPHMRPAVLKGVWRSLKLLYPAGHHNVMRWTSELHWNYRMC